MLQNSRRNDGSEEEMTNILKELKELDAKATSAPWIVEKTSGRNMYVRRSGLTISEIKRLQHCWEEMEINAQLIAATRNALPELIRVIELAESALQNADNAVWADIVSGAFPQRTQLRNQIQQALSEIRKLKGE